MEDDDDDEYWITVNCVYGECCWSLIESRICNILLFSRMNQSYFMKYITVLQASRLHQAGFQDVVFLPS